MSIKRLDMDTVSKAHTEECANLRRALRDLSRQASDCAEHCSVGSLTGFARSLSAELSVVQDYAARVEVYARILREWERER